MAAITLALLWLFQLWFFDVVYYDRQEAHIKSISADLLENDYGISSPYSWELFEPTAKKQNLNIYIFIFNKNNIKQGSQGYSFPDNTELSFYTPYYSNSSANIADLNWDQTRINEYLTQIADMGEEKTFTFIEKSDDEDSVTDTLVYGGELRGEFGGNLKGYFCLIATVSKNNYTVTILRNMLFFVAIAIFGVSIILSLIFSRRLSRPINRLAVTAEQLAAGDYNVKFESKSFREVQQLASSLEFAKEEMRQTEQMRREFIANISHDLRTPLTMIKAYGEMIRDLSGRNDEKRTKHCQIIIDESNRLSLLVADIQKLSKLQSGTDTFEFKNFDLSELCKTVLHRFSIMSETQGYVLNAECDESAFCYGDYPKIEQVLYNLIGNALNYTGDDKKVTVRCKDIGDGYKVEIIDTGKGIDPEEIDSVWDRYYRANQKKRNIVGSGLGLNIVKIILDGHNTKYGVESELNKGTTFWFILPKGN